MQIQATKEHKVLINPRVHDDNRMKIRKFRKEKKAKASIAFEMAHDGGRVDHRRDKDTADKDVTRRLHTPPASITPHPSISGDEMEESPPQYSLKWNNHQSHIMTAFGALLHAESLVDVSLVCAELTIRAHKVVLSACSPFFEKLFADTPCKHPVIVLNDYGGWEIQAIVDFMYKGEISVGQVQLSSLMRAADSLQIRGLAQYNEFNKNSLISSTNSNFCQSVRSYQERERDRSTPIGASLTTTPPLINPPLINAPLNVPRAQTPNCDRDSPQPARVASPPSKVPHMAQTFSDPVQLQGRDVDCTSPTPRRKQARPRRRSGEFQHPQDLSKSKENHDPTNPKDNAQTSSKDSRVDSPKVGTIKVNRFEDDHSEDEQNYDREDEFEEDDNEEEAEDLCVKKERQPSPINPLFQNHPVPLHHQMLPQQVPLNVPSIPLPNHPFHGLQHQPHRKSHSPVTSSSHSQPLHLHSKAKSPEVRSSSSPRKGMERLRDFHYSPPVMQKKDFMPPPGMGGMHSEPHSPLPFPPIPSMMTPPHMFGLESPLGLFPPGLDACRNPLLDLNIGDSHNQSEQTPLFTKKKMGRPKGQHSAPRGGPPRSWTNAELTEALQHVWNKKMTTSQASRIFGIPYNSLLMYVRGKYGKSLKLEQLRKDCEGSPGGPLDLLGLQPLNNNTNTNNHNHKTKSHESHDMGSRPPSSEAEMMSGMFNPFPSGFYPDFAAGFPLPVNMLHLLPQHHMGEGKMTPSQSQRPGDGPDDDGKSDSAKDTDDDNDNYSHGMGATMFSGSSRDEKVEVQQSGSN